MYVLNSMCFMCLTTYRGYSNLKEVTKRDEIFEYIKYALPEITIEDFEIPVHICKSCRTALRTFHMYKKKCLNNYSRWKNYIQILQDTSRYKHQRYCKLDVRLNKKDISEYNTAVEEEDFLGFESSDINKKSRYSFDPLCQPELQIIIDNIQLVKEENKVSIVPNITYENEDAFMLWEEQNDQKTLTEDIIIKEDFLAEQEVFTITLNIEEEENSSPSLDNIVDNEFHQQVVQYEPVLDNGIKLHYTEENKVYAELMPWQGTNIELNKKEEIDDPLLNEQDDIETSLHYTSDIKEESEISEKQELYQEVVEYDSVPDDEEDGVSNITNANSDIKEESEISEEQELLQQVVKYESVQDGTSSIANANNDETDSNSDGDYKEYKCIMCKKVFRNQLKFYAHAKIHIDAIKGKECPICNKIFTTPSGVLRHARTHFGIRDKICSLCSKSYSNQYELTYHMAYIHKINEFAYKCTMCPKKFKNRDSLSIHKKDHLKQTNSIVNTNRQEYKCFMCSEVFSDQLKLNDHANIHHINSITGLKCPVCNKKFRKSSKVILHVKTHFYVKDKVCSICSQSFSSQQALNHHMAEHKVTNDLALECTMCHRKFNNKISLKIHVTHHMKNDVQGIVKTNSQGFKCIMCSEVFSNQLQLNDHANIQHINGIKGLKCPICNRKFNRNSKVIQHVKIHYNVREFGCTICSKMFRQQYYLNEHMKLFHVDKDFTCSICDKKFAIKNTLDAHMAVHSSEKNFNCSLCNIQFSNNDILVKHMKTHLRPRNYECSICDKKFVENSYLLLHMSKCHTANIESSA